MNDGPATHPALHPGADPLLDRLGLEIVAADDPGAGQPGLRGRVRDRADGRTYHLLGYRRGRIVAGGLDRFRAQMRRLAGLRHPHLLPVSRIEQAGDWIFLLRDIGPDQDLLAIDPADQHLFIQTLVSMTDALGALHDAELVHGMPSPARLRVEGAPGRLGAACVVDPGLHQLIGRADWSPGEHWAPELRAGSAPCPQSDLYALGASFLEAAGGSAALRALAAGRRPRFRDLQPELDPDLCRLLDRVLSPERDRRPHNGLALLRELRAPDWALPGRAPRVDLCLSPRLVGRRSELERIDQILDGRRPARALEIVGQPGTGRTALLEEVARRARDRDWRALRWSHAAPGDGLEQLAEAVSVAAGVATPALECGPAPAPATAPRSSRRRGSAGSPAPRGPRCRASSDRW